MDEGVERALKVYGEFLDGNSVRMNEDIINAIRTIREYVYLRNPGDQDTQHAIVMAKRNKMSSAELESLVKKQA